MVCGIALELSRVLRRQELQTINRRFEARPWFNWSAESLRRLNWNTLWQYHQTHEIPCKWWAWDYTLSWLLEHNHPPVKHKIVIFNHLLEDEPPVEAIEQHPWMKPLLTHPLPRPTMAKVIEFLARSGVRLILLDNDFPQYTQDDFVLAKAIHLSTTGGFGSRVPVLMARTVNRRSSGTVLQLEVPTLPSGLIEELKKLEPNTDIVANYTGITGIIPDEDQVVRRLALRLPGLTGVDHESIVGNALTKLHEPIAADAPDVLDVDFIAPPNSELYPVRPLSYLLDPERQQQLVHPSPNSHDVTLNGAIVVLGDSVIDVFNTPFTNEGLNQMSGSEILVQALETLSRGHWPQRLEGKQAILYLVLCSLAAGLIWTSWKIVQQITMSSFRDIRWARLLRSLADLWCFILILCGAYMVACILFAWKGLIVPVFVPSLSLGLGTIGTLLWEREKEREETFKVKLQAAQDKLVLAHERYEADLKRQEAEAKAREVLLDRQRRHEFVRRINHDLNAPVSVLNWTLAELQVQGVDQQESKTKIGRLVKTSDKLCELIDQLVQSYDYETTTEARQIETTNLSKVVEDSLDLQRPLAEMHTSSLSWSLPPEHLWVHGNALELSRIIDNIVRNAIKHNPGGTKVTVAVKTNGSEHTINILDNGKGIAPEHLKHIFEPGYRVDPTRKDSQGLGLDIVKTLVERMGGHISVTSTVGQGSTFAVTIPACEAVDMQDPIKGKVNGDARDNGDNQDAHPNH